MRCVLDNPVVRHGGRLIGRSGRPAALLLLLAAAAGLGLLVQRYWMELEEYSFLRPAGTARWLATTLLAETAVVLPWAAARGALLWRRLEREGHLDEYRRSRLSPAAIVLGALAGALQPAARLLGASLALALTVGLVSGGVTPGAVIATHALLAVQAVAFASLGLFLAARLRFPALAIPAAGLALAGALGAIWLIEPLYPRLSDPGPWIYVALLPNPLTAVGSALGTDVLRFSWVYRTLHAHEYFFVYPSLWQTAALYLAGAAGLTALQVRQVAAIEKGGWR